MLVSSFQNDLRIGDVNTSQNHNDIKPINYTFENRRLKLKEGLINKQRYVGLKSYIYLEPATLRQTRLLMTNTWVV